MQESGFINEIIIPYEILNKEEANLLFNECNKSHVTPEFFMLACRILEKEAILAINHFRKGIFKLSKEQVRVFFNFDILEKEIAKIKNKEKRATLPTYPEIGEEIDKFVIKEVLGKGATSMVYKAYHKFLGIHVVLKVLSPQLTVDDPTIQERFINEARTSARLEHPNVVKILDAGKVNNYSYIAMEYCDSIVLDKALEVKTALEPVQVIKIAIELSKVLSYSLENFGLIHRDIKPGNILLTKSSKVKLMDFGLAKIVNEPDKYQTISGKLYGTLYYMSPEQIIDSNSIDFKADMYSLGCTLYHLITGNRPFDSNRVVQLINMHISHTPQSPNFILPEKVTPRLSKIIMKLIEKVPQNRYSTYEELLFDLKLAVDEYLNPRVSSFKAYSNNRVIQKAI